MSKLLSANLGSASSLLKRERNKGDEGSMGREPSPRALKRALGGRMPLRPRRVAAPTRGPQRSALADAPGGPGGSMGGPKVRWWTGKAQLRPGGPPYLHRLLLPKIQVPQTALPPQAHSRGSYVPRLTGLVYAVSMSFGRRWPGWMALHPSGRTAFWGFTCALAKRVIRQARP